MTGVTKTARSVTPNARIARPPTSPAGTAVGSIRTSDAGAEDACQLERDGGLQLVVAAVGRAACRGASGGTSCRAGTGPPGGGRRRPRRPARPAAAPRTGPCRGSSATSPRAGAGRGSAAPSAAHSAHSPHGWPSRAFSRSGASSSTSAARRSHVNDDVTPTWCSVPSSSKRPEQQRPDVRPGPVLVPPEPGHHAVGGALVLDLEHRPLARLVGASRRLATTPSRPAPSNRSNQSAATRGRASRGSGGPAASRSRSAASSRARRSPCGTSRRSSSPSARRSQATNEAGDSAASMRTRDAAGWMRSRSASKSSAAVRAMTTSPSSTQRSGSWALSGSASSGK